MAALDPVSGLMEIASSLSQDEIPFKLRCAICNKLAINAFRLPCCDQAVCESCQALLPESCPVCAHTPLSADLCKPNKALRTTLKAFLRTEEKKREKARPPAPPAPAVEPEPSESADKVASNSVPLTATSSDQVDNAREVRDVSIAVGDADNSNHFADSIEVREKSDDSKLQMATADDAGNNGSNNELDEKYGNFMAEADNLAFNEGSNIVPQGTPAMTQSNTGVNSPPGDLSSNQPHGMSTHSHGTDTFGSGPGYDVNGMNGYANTGWRGDSNYGHIMQTMGTGVQVNGMMLFQSPTGPPGMPGMGMDPMASSQGMFAGYGMNMNGMNSGMNMGMNFNAGQGMYGAWDGQNNMWNAGPDKFNANPFANRMGAEFGPSPGGYRGYSVPQNYANFPHMHQQQQYPNNDITSHFGPGYGRGRGRGRGFFPSGRGRGGYMSAAHGSYQSSTNQTSSFQPYLASHSHQLADSVSGIPNDTSAITLDPDPDHVIKFNDDLCPGGEEDIKENQPTDEPAAASTRNSPSGELGTPSGEYRNSNTHTDSVLPIDQVIESRTNIQVGAVAQQGNDGSADHGSTPKSGVCIKLQEGTRNNAAPLLNERPHSSPKQFSTTYNNTTPIEARGMGVIGAPAAPRAMREGLPNVGIRNGRGFPAPRTASSPSLMQDKEPQSHSPSQSQEQSTTLPRSTSRSPSRHRSSHHRRHRHRSRSPSISCSDQGKQEHRIQRRKSRRENDDQGSTGKGYKGSRSRSASAEPSERADHRSKRNKERTTDRRSSICHRSRRPRSRSSSHKHCDPEPGASEVNGVDPKPKLLALDENRGLAIRSGDHRAQSDGASGSIIEDKSGRHRDRGRGRDRDSDRDKDRGKDRDKDKYKDRIRQREPKRERERDRERERERDRKRSRRDRSVSPDDLDYSRRRTHRVKRSKAEGPKSIDREKKSADHRESRVQERDPHTLEREARNKERLLKEQQRREAMNADRDGRSSRRRESRQDRTLAGRHLSYKYEDEEDDQARAARVELEREAARWA
ncbi:hypothetical protein AJ78_08779 [Emergomyces pasteurianus Ep9510]|uniref:RING-type domain-containing protein n=1 Tax=Emergomyces pasteurianus Ep9510 TaxID=1447872 RepID=A0A1J9P1I5_9EURO|nr:hypothetical protein AJ78_08779 [Emergomyces pasteurianus Ep9510]